MVLPIRYFVSLKINCVSIKFDFHEFLEESAVADLFYSYRPFLSRCLPCLSVCVTMVRPRTLWEAKILIKLRTSMEVAIEWHK